MNSHPISHHQDHLLRDSANAAVSNSKTELAKWLNLETSDLPLDSAICVLLLLLLALV